MSETNNFKLVEKGKKYLVKHRDVSKELTTLSVSDKLTKSIECRFNIRGRLEYSWITEEDFNKQVLEVVEELPQPKKSSDIFDFEGFDELFEDAKSFGKNFSNLFKSTTTKTKYEKRD